MGKLFSIDSGFFRFMTKVADFMILTFLTILCSLPILTIGPSLTAMFYVSLKIVKDEEGYIVRSFFRSFKQNFVQSFLAELIVVGVSVLMIVVMNISYEWAIKEGSLLPRVIYFLQLGVVVILLAALIYLFPMIARFKNSLFAMCKNSILMAVHHVPQTVMMVIVDALLIAYTINYPVLWIFDVGIIAFANSYVLARVFKLYMPGAQQEETKATESEEDGLLELKTEEQTEPVGENEEISREE